MTNFNNTTYTITEVAEKLNLSDKTLRRWEEAGRFKPSRTDGNQRRYNMEDLQILDAIKHGSLPDQKDLLTIDQAAAMLGVTEPTIDRFVAEGKLHPFITVGHTFYPRHRLIEKLSELTPPKPILTPQPTPAPAPQPSPQTNTTKLQNLPAQAGWNTELPHPASPSISSPLPSLISTPTPLTIPPSPLIHKSYILNLASTIILILGYHFLFNQSSTPISPTPTGQVQGVATSPMLTLLEDMLDPSTGSLSANTLTSKLGISSPNLTLLPGTAPTSPLAGSLYFDGTDNTLKVYTPSGWITLVTTPELENLKIDLQSLTESNVATTSSE